MLTTAFMGLFHCFDITTEEKVKALAMLETEEEHNTPKKWKNNEASLSSFLGLAR